MKTKLPLHIHIPKPCNQDWSAMQQAGDGKYCSSCNNVVYDFSGMNDDELLNFFKNNPNTHCGRFHNSQLNRNILPTKKKRRLLISRFNKIAAAVFTVLSFRHISLQAENRNAKPALALDAQFKKNILPDGKIMITGAITDGSGNPIEKAVVQFDSVQVATTNKNGEFSFELQSVTATNHTLYFSYDGLITVVRTYNPSMQSTDYSIKLYKQGVSVSTGTGGIISFSGFENLPNLSFANGSIILNKTNKNKLDVVSLRLKENPMATLSIRAFSSSVVNEKIALKRTQAIKNYMVESEGISPERLTIKIQKSGGDINTIDFLNQ